MLMLTMQINHCFVLIVSANLNQLQLGSHYIIR